MTLIVAVVAGNWAFHASDRVVSAEPTPDNPTGEFDPHSNKTVVVVGTDCWVVLGYTGIAYLDGKPTDHLIAEAISGCDEFSPAMYTFWQQPPDLHYRKVRRRMEDKLRDAYSRLPDSEKGRVTLVLASGVQEKDGIVTKVMFRTKVQGDSVTSIEMRPETPGFKGFYIDAVGMVKNEIIDRTKARLSAIGPPVTAAEVPDVRPRHTERCCARDEPADTQSRRQCHDGRSGQPRPGHQNCAAHCRSPTASRAVRTRQAEPTRFRPIRRDVDSSDAVRAHSRRDLGTFYRQTWWMGHAEGSHSISPALTINQVRAAVRSSAFSHGRIGPSGVSCN